MLKPLVRAGLGAGLKSWPAVLLFEITYKIAGYFLFLNLWNCSGRLCCGRWAFR